MGIVTHLLINEFFKKYHSIEVTFNQDVSKATGLQSKKIFLKFREEIKPCILYACSMEDARVLVSLSRTMHQFLSKNRGNISLKLSFMKDEHPRPVEVNFFVPGRLTGFDRYSENKVLEEFRGLSSSRPRRSEYEL